MQLYNALYSTPKWATVNPIFKKPMFAFLEACLESVPSTLLTIYVGVYTEFTPLYVGNTIISILSIAYGGR
jgi:hypothetical protein